MGFFDTPYSSKAVPATEAGTHVLVGRDAEIARLHNKLEMSDRVITVEGDNGVGKTSMVRVASYLARERFTSGATKQLFLPVDDVFQLTSNTDLDGLADTVLFALANALIKNRETLLEHGRAVSGLDEIDRWLNASETVGREGTGTLGPVSIGGGKSTNLSTTDGFTRAGFASAVKRALNDAFPLGKGGFVCILDNLELLKTSTSVGEIMQDMRDSLLDLEGVRWVACGAAGVVRGAAASIRWSGLLSKPIELAPLGDESIRSVLTTRVDFFKDGNALYVPVDEDGFYFAYQLFGKNLRSALGACQDYSEWLVEDGQRFNSSEDKLESFQRWLSDEGSLHLEAIVGVGKRAWALFDNLAGEGGNMSPGDHDKYGFSTYQALNEQSKKLKAAGLLKKVAPKIDKDQRTKAYEISPEGWKVALARGFRAGN
jgi:hypothetical protein